MRTLWRGIVRVAFWSYERGTWQYDLAVVGIALFVLFSPRIIRFNDQPLVGPSPSPAMIELRGMAPGQIATYRVDARLLASPIRTPELEHDLHATVQKNVQDFAIEIRNCTSSPSAAKAARWPVPGVSIKP